MKITSLNYNAANQAERYKDKQQNSPAFKCSASVVIERNLAPESSASLAKLMMTVLEGTLRAGKIAFEKVGDTVLRIGDDVKAAAKPLVDGLNVPPKSAEPLPIRYVFSD